jgi:hypothetical protein
MPEFKDEVAAREKKKADELAPYIEAAFKRKEFMKELADDEIPTYPAYGAMVAETQIDTTNLDEATKQRMARWQKMREVLSKA